MNNDGIFMKEFETRLRNAADEIISDLMKEYFGCSNIVSKNTDTNAANSSTNNNITESKAKPSISKKMTCKSVDLEFVVTDYFRTLGIPAHIKGYQYGREAIMFCVKSPDKISSITKILYPEIAKIFNTTPSRVERAIRHSIEVAWLRGNSSKIIDLFGYTVDSKKGRPTNSEFIALIADKIRLAYPEFISK